MTDLALTITVETTSVTSASGDLSALTKNAREVETAVQNIAAAFRAMAGQASVLSTALRGINGSATEAKSGIWDLIDKINSLGGLISTGKSLAGLAGDLRSAGLRGREAAGGLQGFVGLLRGVGTLASPAGVAVLALGGAWLWHKKAVEDSDRAAAETQKTFLQLRDDLGLTMQQTYDLAGATKDSTGKAWDAVAAYNAQANAASNLADKISQMTYQQKLSLLQQTRKDIKDREERLYGNRPFEISPEERYSNAKFKALTAAHGKTVPRLGLDGEDLFLKDATKDFGKYSPKVQDLIRAAWAARESMRQERALLAGDRVKARVLERETDPSKPPKVPSAQAPSAQSGAPRTTTQSSVTARSSVSLAFSSGPTVAEQAQQTMALAAAYRENDVAAMKLQASRAALEDTTSRGATAEAHLARAVAEQALAGAKAASDLRARAAAQKAANDAVASGKMTSEQAQQAMESSLSLRSLETAKDAASGEQKKALEGIINDLTGATKDWNAEQARSEVLQATESAQQKIELLNTEFEMIGKTNRERAVSIAQKEAEQYLDQHDIKDPDKRSAYIASQVDLAAGTQELRSAQDNYNGSLRFTLDLLGQMHSQAQDVAAGLANAFGAPGQALGGLLTSFTGLKANLEEIRLKYDEIRAAAEAATHSDQPEVKAAAIKRLSEVNVLAANEESNARRKAYGDMLVAAKGFFKEGSAGWRLMQAAEAGYRAFQLAASIRAIVQNATETSTSVANAGVRGTADGAAGVAKIFSQLGMWAFPVAAAAIAFMASAGVNAQGGGSAPTFDLEAKQKAQGTGSVFGDSTLKSASIQNALEDSLDAQEKMAGYQNSMVSHLRSIDAKIGAFANVLTRQITGGRMFSTDGLNLGSTSTRGFGSSNLLASGAGGALGYGLGSMAAGAALPGWALAGALGPVGLVLGALAPLLFSSKTTRTLQDQGLQFPDQTVGQIMDSGAQGSAYQQVLENTKKKFFGITYSDKNRTSTAAAPLDDDVLAHINLIVESLRSGVLDAAKTLGIDGAEATIDSFQVALGEISLKDMTGEEIQETLNAVFGKLADDMAAFVGGDLLDQYQQIGEGQFETMVRLANGLQVVRAQLENAGVSFNYVGVAAVNASQAMINAAGGLDAFVSGMEFFTQNFLTEEERMATTTERVTAAMAALGLAGVTTIEQFKAAMQSALAIGDAVKVAGLIDIQKDFLDVEKYQEKMAQAQAQLASTAASVATSASSASSSLSQVNDGFGDLIKNLKKFRDELIKGPAANLSPEDQYRIAAADFDRVSKLAAGGDQQAQSELQTVSQALLTASKAYYASSQGYNDDFERVLAVLDKIVGPRPETVGLVGGAFPGDMPPPRILTGDPDVSRRLIANDNEEIADLLREVKDELRAANIQRGAVGEAQLKRLEKVCDQLDATKRELARA